MAGRGVKRREGENLTDASIKKVIELLNASPAITKKEACEILRISYNTTRLGAIIDEYNSKQDYRKQRISYNRGRPATKQEISEAVMGYLNGEPISAIAKGLFRSTAFVKNLLDNVGVPTKPATAEERNTTAFIPDQCIAESFSEGQIVWSAKHHTAAIIDKEISVDYQAEKPGFIDVNYEKKYGSRCYAIYVMQEIRESDDFWVANIDTGGYFAYALAYDLASLEHLKEYGVDLKRI